MPAVLTILLALDDHGREEELAAALAEERDVVLTHAADLDASGHADVVVSDVVPLDDVTPHVIWGGTGGHGANVRARLPSDMPVQTVVAAIRVAAAGYRIVAGETRRDGARADFADMPLSAQYHLSAREREVLALLAEGAPNKVIARRLGISVHTAKFHVAAVVAKLGAANRTEAIGIAMREGLVLI